MLISVTRFSGWIERSFFAFSEMEWLKPVLVFLQDYYNYGHKILRIFDILSVIIRKKVGIYELSHELPNNLRISISEN